MVAEVKDLFEAKARSLIDVFRAHAGVAGYRIPIYQRHYDWDKEKISRVFEDCVGGFGALAEENVEEAFTFLGTIILVKGSRRESSFGGTSLDVVDGQQRLTTLAIMACALQEELERELRLKLSDPEQPNEFWLQDEARHQLDLLYDCVLGVEAGRGRRSDKPFPRIVRHSDHRARSGRDSEYRSLVARYLVQFGEHVDQEIKKPFEPEIAQRTGEERRFRDNVGHIKRLVRLLLDPETDEEEVDVHFPLPEEFDRRSYRGLLLRLPQAQDEINRRVTKSIQEDRFHGLLRLVLFSSYFTHHVALTTVEVQEEKYAFDIFDALNTTGEPLTAIETFRPQVIEFEDQVAGYEGSDSYHSLCEVEDFTDRFEDPGKRQAVTKDLIVVFALYIDGQKKGKQLNEQRRFLRGTYSKLTGKRVDARRRFVGLLANVAKYTQLYWEEEGIKGVAREEPQVALCLNYLKDLKTSLTIPVLARYYEYCERIGSLSLFYDAVRALTAFVVLRRAATGQTRGIDSDLRRLMDKGGPGQEKRNIPLKAGLERENEVPSLELLKRYLRGYLARRRVGVEDKESWVKAVASQPLADKSKPTCRLLFLAAIHQSRPDRQAKGLLMRERARPSSRLDYLNYKSWRSEEHRTVEHVAPESDPGSGWDPEIYSKLFLKHTIGNLVLLPERENASLGNAAWRRKRIYYQAFAAQEQDELEECLGAANRAGLGLGRRAERLVREGRELPLAEAIAAVKTWDAAFIERRTVNLAELAWDTLAGWVYEPSK